MNARNIVLVTGVNGFVGHHVANSLFKNGYRVLGLSNQDILESDLTGVVEKYIACDLTSQEDIKKINLSDIMGIINLAGFAKVGDSKGQGELYNKVNVGVHTVLYDECLRQGVNPRIIAVSTGAVYDPNQAMPINEKSRLISKSSTNEYVVSKQLMEESLDLYRNKGLRIITVRPFNHSGPGQLPGFLLPDLGEQIKNAKTTGKPLMVGNLKTKRDYTDVRDVARAYVELATCEDKILRHNLYNICSGKSVAGEDILKMMLEAFNETGMAVEIDPDRLRKNDVMDIYGSHDLITADVGWKPEIPVEKMIRDYVNWKETQ